MPILVLSCRNEHSGLFLRLRQLTTSPHVEKLSYAYAPNDESPGNVVATTQTCNAQNRASADAVTCTNNER